MLTLKPKFPLSLSIFILFQMKIRIWKGPRSRYGWSMKLVDCVNSKFIKTTSSFSSVVINFSCFSCTFSLVIVFSCWMDCLLSKALGNCTRTSASNLSCSVNMNRLDFYIKPNGKSSDIIGRIRQFALWILFHSRCDDCWR